MIERTVEAVVFVWEGTAVSDQHASATRVRHRVEALCAMGVDIAVVSSSSLEALDRQLRARPSGPGHLWLCPHRGTELVQIQPDGPELPLQCAERPKKSPVRLRRISVLNAGTRVNAEGTRIELGSLAPSDSVRELLGWWEQRGLTGGLILVVGTEFDPVDGADSSVGTSGWAQGLVVPVSAESVGGPARVLHACGGPAELIELLDEQLRRRRHRRVPAVDEDPARTIRVTGIDPLRHRVTETLLAMGAAGFVTRCSVEEGRTGSMPLVLASGVYQGTGSDQRPLAGPGWTGLVIEPVASEMSTCSTCVPAS